MDAEAIDHSEARINVLGLTGEQAGWLLRLLSGGIVLGLGYVMRGRIVSRDRLNSSASA